MIQLKQLYFDYPEMPMQFEMEVPQGQCVAIVGESGSGKSTLLNLIAGFERPSSGEIWLADCNHTQTLVAQRPVSMLFQENNLFPHLSVAQNIGLALAPRLSFTPTEQAKITEIAQQVGLENLLTRQADQLSGGQKQRTALARTLLRDQPILLLDEPFSALDPSRRNELQRWVIELCRQRQITLLMVTHQWNEVAHLVDRIIEVAEGKIKSDKVDKLDLLYSPLSLRTNNPTYVDKC